MGFARVQAILHNDSGLPQDQVINTWHFAPPGDVSSSAVDITDGLNAFYQAIDSLLSPVLLGTIDFKVYDLEDAPPRVPVAEIAGTSLTLGSQALPNEVACCMSFQGAIASGQNQARRRGRVFLGPMSVASGTAAAGDVRPAAATRTTITNAGAALIDVPGINWSVFSPTVAGSPPWDAGSLAGAFTLVTNGWVDDAYDTQRRRGLRTSTRTTFS